MTKTAVQQAAAYASKREASRARRAETERLKRERLEEGTKEFKRLAEIHVEKAREQQAPKQQRVGVEGVTARSLKADEQAERKPTPIILREALVDADTRRGGYRRADPLTRMHGKAPGMVTRVHLAAARKFSEDYEVGDLGASMSGGVTEHVDGGGSTPEVSERRLDAIARYRAACDAIGPSMRTAVQLVVLHRRSMADIASLLAMPETRASGWLLAGLDRLADFYFPDRATRIASVDRVLMVDEAVTDVPQERLGRRKKAA